MKIRQLIFSTIILALFVSTLCFVIFHSYYPELLKITYLLLPIFFGLINIFIFYRLSKLKDSTISKFTNQYLLGTTIKLLFSLAFILIYLILNRNEAIPFLSAFLSIYFIFLFQEIMGILKFFKKKEKIEASHSKT